MCVCLCVCIYIARPAVHRICRHRSRCVAGGASSASSRNRSWCRICKESWKESCSLVFVLALAPVFVLHFACASDNDGSGSTSPPLPPPSPRSSHPVSASADPAPTPRAWPMTRGGGTSACRTRASLKCTAKEQAYTAASTAKKRAMRASTPGAGSAEKMAKMSPENTHSTCMCVCGDVCVHVHINIDTHTHRHT